ncbi:hypothetical protein HYT56_05335, partial [Candidatus Woesearchaeota archaeon]|nr:hypothetical protein [Candidatus Woesearchaeota archaeon]
QIIGEENAEVPFDVSFDWNQKTFKKSSTLILGRGDIAPGKSGNLITGNAVLDITGNVVELPSTQQGRFRCELVNKIDICCPLGYQTSNQLGAEQCVKISKTAAAKPLAFIPIGSPGIPGLAALYGDLNADDCIKQDDLDKWKRGKNRGAFDASVLRTVHDLDFNADALIDDKDEKIIQDNLGKCFEKDTCTQQYSNEEERNKCLYAIININYICKEFNLAFQ